MDLKRLAGRAKQMVDAAGGAEGVKEKASGLRDVASGSGSLSDKAKAAAEVVREGPPAAAEADRASAAAVCLLYTSPSPRDS